MQKIDDTIPAEYRSPEFENYMQNEFCWGFNYADCIVGAYEDSACKADKVKEVVKHAEEVLQTKSETREEIVKCLNLLIDGLRMRFHAVAFCNIPQIWYTSPELIGLIDPTKTMISLSTGKLGNEENKTKYDIFTS